MKLYYTFTRLNARLRSSCGWVSIEKQLSWVLNCTVWLLHGLKGVLDGSELKTFCVIMDNGILENVHILSFSVKKSSSDW